MLRQLQGKTRETRKGDRGREGGGSHLAAAAAAKRGKVGDELELLAKHFGENEIFEIALVVNLYMFLNTFNNLLVR